ncbi:MAG: HD domain-containing protein [Alphaproteobacteria bacterium]|nr:HD domain-containing protein [Alphaproteobacteria bacterium]
MKDGTQEDYELLHEKEAGFLSGTADRLLHEMARQGEETLEGYKITRLEHGLQSATRAEREGGDIDWIVSALLHDIGDGLAPQNHDRMAAEILRPFVREECAWVVEHHGLFQTYYFGHHYGWDRNARDKFKDHQHFQACVDFCERWDQASFDPGYASEGLEHFAPLVREVFARSAYAPEVVQESVSIGLPAR